MDYLRHQIEASLGRSEELLTSDKARRIFYRYPSSTEMVQVPKPIKSAKERGGGNGGGTFNSVRLKKYLGFGASKRKQQQQKVDSDDLQQQMQQHAYLEELQRYGAVATVPPLPPPNHPHFHPHYEATMTRFHPTACFMEPPWPPFAADKGTVGPGRMAHLHFPNVYSTVSASSRTPSRQRASLQSAVYAWEPYGQTPAGIAVIGDVSAAIAASKDGGGYHQLRCPCTCDDHAAKPVTKRRTKCTCGTSTVAGTRSGKRGSKSNSRPSLFGIGDLGVAKVKPAESTDNDRALAVAGRHQQQHTKRGNVVVIHNDNYINGYAAVNNMNNNNNSPRHYEAPAHGAAKSRLHRLSDASTMQGPAAYPPDVTATVVLTTFQSSSVKQSAGLSDGKQQRRSILETTVNPYELLVKAPGAAVAATSVQQSSRRQSTPADLREMMSQSVEDLYEDGLMDNGLSEKDSNGNTDHKRATSVSRSQTNSNKKSTKSKKSKSVADDDEVMDISLGGQRIRLFGTVKGTSPTNRHANGNRRGSIPTFPESPAPSLVPSRPAPPPPPPPPQRSSSFLSNADLRDRVNQRASENGGRQQSSDNTAERHRSATPRTVALAHDNSNVRLGASPYPTPGTGNSASSRGGNGTIRSTSGYGEPSHVKPSNSSYGSSKNSSLENRTGTRGGSSSVTPSFRKSVSEYRSSHSDREHDLPIDYDWQEESENEEELARQIRNKSAWHKTTIRIGNHPAETGNDDKRNNDFRSRLASLGSTSTPDEGRAHGSRNTVTVSTRSSADNGYGVQKYASGSYAEEDRDGVDDRVRRSWKQGHSSPPLDRREHGSRRQGRRSPELDRRRSSSTGYSSGRRLNESLETDDAKMASKVSPYATSSIVPYTPTPTLTGSESRGAGRLSGGEFQNVVPPNLRQQSLPISATVITVGQSIQYDRDRFDEVETPIADRRLSLKINLSDLSAYLKPILKKASLFNESSTSSDTDAGGAGGGSDSINTYGGSTSDSIQGGSGSTSTDFRLKQKKHVHFLAHRVSTGSEESLSKDWTEDEEEDDDGFRTSSNESLENDNHRRHYRKSNVENGSSRVAEDGGNWGESSRESRLSGDRRDRGTPDSTSQDSTDNDDVSVSSQQDLYADGSSGPSEEVVTSSNRTSGMAMADHQWPDRPMATESSKQFGNRSCVIIGAKTGGAALPLKKDIEGHINCFMKRRETTITSSAKENIAPASVLNDYKRTSLRRSQSERQISGIDDCEPNKISDNLRSSPSRSNSFQVLTSNVAGEVHSSPSIRSEFSEDAPTRLSRSVSKNERNARSTVHVAGPKTAALPSIDATGSDKRNLARTINSQPFYQNNLKDGGPLRSPPPIPSQQHSNANGGHFVSHLSSASAGAPSPAPSNDRTENHLQLSSTQHFRKFNSSPVALQESSLLKRIKELNGSGGSQNGFLRRNNNSPIGERWSNTSGSASSSQSFSNAPCLPPANIAKLRAIPKFLPRPHYNGKHLHHVCALYSDNKIAEVQEPEEEDEYDDGGAIIGSQWESEEDLYADGESSLNSTIRNEPIDFNKSAPLPPIPTESPPHSPTPSFGDNSDDSVIYEQIGEPVYEEVPHNLTYTSTTSTCTGSLGLPRKSIFEGASKTEILSYLEDAKERGVENIETSAEESGLLAEEDSTEKVQTPQTSVTKRHHRNRVSNISNLSDSSQTSEESFQNEESQDAKDRHSHSSAEVERNDSGVGSETGKPSRLRRQPRLGSNEQVCIDCDQALDSDWDSEDALYVSPLVCKKCSKKRSERKEIILEFVETEVKYGRDLKIIKEEFHRPMLVAGLLTEEQLNNIFINLDQLILVNEIFAEKLKDALDIAAEQGDEDYSNVDVGKIFQESSAMLHAFEGYCVRQGAASMLLTNLEKEKELLRVFLKVSQMENTLLRRLNLNSFLMVPVQRITKYPLLLNRLYKVTPHHHQDRESLRESQQKVELHLEHINQQAKDFSGMNLWRRISNISNSQRRNLLEPVIGNIKLKKMALEVLQWNSDDVRYVMEGRLQYMQITENLWSKKERTLKLTSIHGLLITLGNPNANYRPDLADRDNIFPRNTGIKEATLVLIKEKNNRFNLIREPLLLQKCVISSDQDFDDVFEVQEFTTKDAYLLKGDDAKDTQEWLKMLRYHAKDLGAWRRRRNALANIMINGMVARREWL